MSDKGFCSLQKPDAVYRYFAQLGVLADEIMFPVRQFARLAQNLLAYEDLPHVVKKSGEFDNFPLFLGNPILSVKVAT